MDNDVLEQVKAEGMPLQEGQTARSVCPVCNGGRSKETSFSVTRQDGGLVFHCFRDKCRCQGFVGSRGNFLGQSLSQSKKTDTNQYTGELYVLSDKSAKFLKNKFYLEDSDLAGFLETPNHDIMIPMLDHIGRCYGYINRRYQGLVGSERIPKTINYYDYKPEHNLHFAQPISSTVTNLVLVEDIISAIRVAKHSPCAALLGTNLSENAAVFLCDLGIKDVAYLLDADANATSKKLANRYSMLFRRSESLLQPLSAPDPKDCTADELKALMSRIKEFDIE